MKHGRKAAAIREHLAANPSASTKDVVAALAAKRIAVSPTQVYGLRSAKPKAKLNGYEPLVQAKKMADAMGGLEKAREALDALDQILG